jgi:hypothetical protein
VIVPEGGPHLLAMGERQIPEPPKTSPKYRPGHPLTLIADESPFLKRVLEERQSVLIPDTKTEKDLRQGIAERNKITWLRTKSGDVKLTAYSADRIHFDGQSCVLAVSADLPEYNQHKVN